MSSKTYQKQDLEQLFLSGFLEEEEKQPPTFIEKKPRVIVLSGPTGCGKSALGMLLAEAIGGEIVSADSIQIYKGMNIGTAKPTEEDQKLVPHHLIDIRKVFEPYNVVEFYYEAEKVLQSILARDKIPIIVGGSGFYLHALLYGPPSGPPSVAQVRKNLEDEMEKKGAEVLYNKLCQLDLEYAQTVSMNDKHKIIRALEIIELTGKKVSAHPWKSKRVPRHYNFRCWHLNRPKSILYKRIEKRCEKMLAMGLLDEVFHLIQNGIEQNPSACQAIGYRQSLEFLKGDQTLERYHQFVGEFKKASRHYAKRQLTWFRREPLFHWLDLELHDPETAVGMIQRDYDFGL